MDALFFAFGGYLIGSIPFAVVVSRMMGLEDPRSYGSGNPGATNVLRSGSKAAAALTLLGDAAKARKRLGWTPTHTFQQLVESMVEGDLQRYGPATSSTRP